MAHNETPPVIVALDYSEPAQALTFLGQLDPGSCRVKIGKELFCVGGPDLVRRCIDSGFDVFLDLKYHDIPNTVAGACRAAARLGVWMVDVHACGGRRMMDAARDAIQGTPRPPLLTAVTVLTSHDQESLAETGVVGSIDEQVERLTGLAVASGLDGVVCSAREAALLRERFGSVPVLVTPGIRPSGSSADDQTRVVTPAEALAAGANHLVVGRPITRAADPKSALAAIVAELQSAA